MTAAPLCAADVWQADADQAASEYEYLRDSFLAAARAGDMSAKAMFAPMVRDWSGSKADLRYQPVGECLSDAHDCVRDVGDYRLMGILAAAARGENVQATAAALLAQMAHKWADMTVGSEA